MRVFAPLDTHPTAQPLVELYGGKPPLLAPANPRKRVTKEEDGLGPWCY